MELRPQAAAQFDQLRSSAAHPAVVDWLWRTASEGDDFDGYQINAFRVAAEAGVSRLDAARAFLFATRLGVTDLTWDIHCPSCMGVPEYHRHLMELTQRGHCTLCELRWDVNLEDQIEASFTLNPNVRPIDVGPFREARWPEAREVFFKRLAREGRNPVAGVMIKPGETAVVSATVGEGAYHYQIAGRSWGGGVIAASGAPAEGEQVLRLHVSEDGSIRGDEATLRPGAVRLEVTSDYPKLGFGMLLPAGSPRNWVSAAYLTTLQDFRDLFGGEFLAPDRSFALRSVTLLFTDITGSTEMYERLGDTRAYALVQQHFELMTEVIRRREGGIVKTIGDAVMAAFSVNADAVAAALEIQEGFATVADPLRQITVKIGLHRGPTIAVTSNRMLDYFGRTVNLAARVQGASEPGEILISEAVAADPVVAGAIAARGIVPARREVTMKGIAGSVPVLSLRAATG